MSAESLTTCSMSTVDVDENGTPGSAEGGEEHKKPPPDRLGSFVKKIRMGKRVGMGLGKDKGQASSAGAADDDDPNKPPEPYICTGHFRTDFTELAKRNSMACVPPVVLRAHRPPSPSAAPVLDEKKDKKGGKGKQAEAPPPEPEPEPELDENGELPEPPPKTYVTKEKFEFFKPSVAVEMDNPDKEDTVSEMYIRGWKVDEPMMTILKQCMPKMDRLHTINFWNTGLEEDSIETLAALLPELSNLRNLVLDNNPVKTENWHLLLKDESPIQALSLRHNRITDKGCESLGQVLGTPTVQNSKLVSLNLNGNLITDKGAAHLAGGLRMNRTLLSLSLAHNQIENAGAQKLAEVLSRFPLTHEEIVERRKLSSGVPDRTKSVSKGKQGQDPPPGSRRADSRDRPPSVRSSHGLSGTTKGGKSAKAGKKGEKGKEEDSKHNKTKGKGGEAEKTKGKGGNTVSGRSSGASVVADTAKTAGKGKDKTKGKGKGAAQPDAETSETPELINPLLDEIEHLANGVIMLVGNRTLINLNLSFNDIGEFGIDQLHLAVGYQTSILQFRSKLGGNGLMRLNVNRNKVRADSEKLLKLNELMLTKDPFYKPPSTSPDQESQQSKVTN